jgi:hypothetical protein
MSVLGDIISKIFSHASAAPAASPAAGAPASSSAPASQPPAAPDASPAPASTSAAASASKPAAPVDVTAILDKLAAQSKEKLDWRHSIVDMMKLLNLDSSLGARKHLAEELHYTGNTNDSASMNVWLHGQVMTKLAENGGVVPNDLKA